MSSPPPASPPMVWPPSNPSGTVIPFPLPWGQTGCCPPGGMDALMKCYCDIQQASAFIGQVMLDQINNNPAIIAAIIAGIEKSGSSVPLIGVTNGAAAQPGQVGEVYYGYQTAAYATGNASGVMTMPTLAAGDWDVWSFCTVTTAMDQVQWGLQAVNQPGFNGNLQTALAVPDGVGVVNLPSNQVEALTTAPSLMNIQWYTTTAAAAGEIGVVVMARRRR